MKKLFFIFLIINVTIYASDLKKASSIFTMIAQKVTQKTSPNIFIYKELEALEAYPNRLNIVRNCVQADMVILSTTKDIPSSCRGKLFFGTRYSHLKNSNVIGAFFWHKGRPNILFYQSRLDKNGIKLDSTFSKYIDD